MMDGKSSSLVALLLGMTPVHQRFVPNSQIAMDYGLWTMDYGLWTMDYDYGLMAIECGSASSRTLCRFRSSNGFR